MDGNLVWRLNRMQRRVIRNENEPHVLMNELMRNDVSLALTYICIVPRRVRTLLQIGCLLIALILLVSFVLASRILMQPNADCVKMMLDFSPNKGAQREIELFFFICYVYSSISSTIGVFQVFVPMDDKTLMEKFEVEKKINSDSVLMIEVENFVPNNNDDNLVDYLSYKKLTIDGFGKDIFYTNNFMSAVEFSFVAPLLQLSNSVRVEENITVRTIMISRHSSICFNNLINEYDTIIKTNMKEMATQLAKNKLSTASKNSKGYISDLRTGRISEINESFSFRYRFFSSVTFFYIFVSVIIAFFNYTQYEFNGIRIFYNHLLNRGIVRQVLLISKTFTLLMAVIGIDYVAMKFFQNRFVLFIVIWSIYEAINVNLRSFQSPISRKYWYRFYFLYLWFFLTSELFYTQFTNMSFSIYIFLNLYTFLFFFNYYEIPHFFATNSTFILQYQLFKQTHQVHHLPIYGHSHLHRNLLGRSRRMYYGQNLQSAILNWRIVKYMLQASIICCEYLNSLLPDDFLQDQPEDIETRFMEIIQPQHFGFYCYVRLIVRFALFGPERPFSERQPPYVVETERFLFDNDNENETENIDDNDDNDENRSVSYNGADSRISHHSGRSESSSIPSEDDDDIGNAFDEVNLNVDDL